MGPLSQVKGASEWPAALPNMPHPPGSWGLRGEGGCGRGAAIGWRQLLLRDCSGLGSERAKHVL